MQYGIGLVVEQWPSQDGHYPVAAYQAAFGLSLALQAAALVWFAMPWIRTFAHCVTEAAENGGPMLFARMGMMQATNQHKVEEFDPKQKRRHWGRRKLARDR